MFTKIISCFFHRAPSPRFAEWRAVGPPCCVIKDEAMAPVPAGTGPATRPPKGKTGTEGAGVDQTQGHLGVTLPPNSVQPRRGRAPLSPASPPMAVPLTCLGNNLSQPLGWRPWQVPSRLSEGGRTACWATRHQHSSQTPLPGRAGPTLRP